MRCPFCGHSDTQVKDSRPTEDNTAIRRRRPVPTAAPVLPPSSGCNCATWSVIKSNGQREPFDRDKLLRSMRIALRKRPVDPDRLERVVNGIVRRLESSGESEIATEADRRGGDGRAGQPRHGRLCALRLGLQELPRSQGFRRLRRQEGGGDATRMSGGRTWRHHDRTTRTICPVALAAGPARPRPDPWPNPRSAASVVRRPAATRVGRGWTQPGGRPHAETEALDQARARRGQRGAAAYVTLEPCSPSWTRRRPAPTR